MIRMANFTLQIFGHNFKNLAPIERFCIHSAILKVQIKVFKSR